MTDIPCRCRRPMSAARKIADGVGQCPCGAKWYRVDFGKHCDDLARLDNYNRAMRLANTPAKRRKFAITGRV